MEGGPGDTKARARRAVGRHRGLVARTLLVSGLTLLSRLLGFAREALMAAVFGDRSLVSDAFLTAWRFPNLFRRLLGEGALSVALQTAMTKADIEAGDAAGRALFRAVLRRTLAALALVTVLGMGLVWILPDRLPGTGWAWLGPVPAIVRDLTVRVLPYVPLVCAAAVLGGALAVRGHFALPNLAPTAMNLVWIASLVAIGLATDWGRALVGPPAEVLAREWELARWLAWGLLAGGVVQLALHLVPLRRFGLAAGGARPDTQHGARQEAQQGARARAVLQTSLPLVLGAAVYQINVMVDGLMANGLLRAGGATVLYYANRLQQFPLALISTAAVNAVFPLLNAHGHLGERARVRALHDRAQLGILFLALPAAAGLFSLALPIASVCYEHGNFGQDGAERVAEGLRLLAVALVPAGAAGLAGRVFVAMDDVRTPVRIAVWMVLLNVALNTLCVVGFGLDVAGLTLATAVTTWVNLLWLLAGLRRELALPAADPGLRARVARIALASLASGAAAFGAQRGAALLLGAADGRRSLPALLGGLAAGALVYGLAAQFLAFPEWRELLQRVTRRAR
jgi:putative peptidoglycan lipid II flippase